MARKDSFNANRLKEIARQKRYNAGLVAKALGISPRHFRRETHKYLNASPKAWLRKLRHEDAVNRLQQGCEVKEVSPDLGFKQLSHFSAEFKKYKGFPPSDFQAPKTV